MSWYLIKHGVSLSLHVIYHGSEDPSSWFSDITSSLKSYQILFVIYFQYSYVSGNFRILTQDLSYKFSHIRSRVTSVSTAIGDGLKGRSLIPDRGKGVFSTSRYGVRLWVPPSLLLFRLKQQDREADHSLPSSSEFTNGAAIPSLPHTFLWRRT
jgi:hypothetical protein